MPIVTWEWQVGFPRKWDSHITPGKLELGRLHTWLIAVAALKPSSYCSVNGTTKVAP